MSDVQTLEHTVVLYSRGDCEFSEMVRLHLESRKQKYTDRDIDLEPEARDEMMRLGGTGTPVTVIDGEVVIGFDEESIDELLGFEPYNPHQDLDGPRIDEP
jgi:glutaredoxin